MMISTENRVEIDLLRKIAKVFLSTKLSAASMSTVYNHYFNPMISSRSYMTVAPVDLLFGSYCSSTRLCISGESS